MRRVWMPPGRDEKASAAWCQLMGEQVSKNYGMAPYDGDTESNLRVFLERTKDLFRVLEGAGYA